MAQSNLIKWEVRSTATANNVNGGGFKTGASGTDYTLQNAAQWTAADGTSNASTTFTSATGGFTAQAIGNVLHLTAGTNGTVGWYEITGYTDANTITLDRNCSTGAMTNGTYYIGGALSLASTLDDDFFDQLVAGQVVYVLGGTAITYTLGEAVSMLTPGAVDLPIKIVGYNTTRPTNRNGTDGDNPSGATRPTFALGANSFTYANYVQVENIIFTSTAAQAISASSSTYSITKNCKITNSSTTATRYAFYQNSGGNSLLGCELISYRGYGIHDTDARINVRNCWIHDCVRGINMNFSGDTQRNIIGNIISHCAISAIHDSAGSLCMGNIINNTLYGAQNKYGIGVNYTAGTFGPTDFMNNIVYGFVTGCTSPTANQSMINDSYNCYNNNTNDVNANWTKGANDVTTNPAFTSITQLVNTGTVTSSTNILTDTGADFSSITDNIDHILIRTMTGTGGVTDTFFGITAHTATTLTLTSNLTSSGSGSAIVYSITIGNNFLPTGAI